MKRRENFTIVVFIIVIIVIISIIIIINVFHSHYYYHCYQHRNFCYHYQSNIIIISQYHGFTRARSILKVTFYPHYSNDKIKTIRERIRTVSVSLPMFLLLSPETENGSRRSERSAGQTMLNSS